MSLPTVELIDVYDGQGLHPAALDILHQVLLERTPEQNISHRGTPTFEQHRQFVTRRPYRAWYLVMAPEQTRAFVGAVYATSRNELGVFILQAWQKRGYGPAALTEFMRRHQPLDRITGKRRDCWLANIAPGNARSKSLFERLGFRKVQETYALITTEEEPRGKSQTSTPTPA